MSVEVEPTGELLAAAERQGWSKELLQRGLRAGMSNAALLRFLSWEIPPDRMERRIEWHERLTFGSLRGREATLDDNDGFADLCANAPEDLGDWEVIGERGPNAFAQLRLQENVSLSVISDGPVLVASCGFATRNVLVADRRMSVRYGQALRVRREYRRQGYADQVRNLGWGIGVALPSSAQYDLMRSQNHAVVSWWKKFYPDSYDGVPEREGDIPGISVSAWQLTARPFDGADTGIRHSSPEDLPRCVELVNRTHRGQDLFRPYSEEFLGRRLDGGYWGERAPSWPHVYGWQDHWVVEERGEVRACAGLWDRGRDMRERWKRKGSDEEMVISDTAVLDLGFAGGCEEAAARLIHFLVGETCALGRDHLLVPVDPLPELATRLESLDPVPETRALRWSVPEPAITRPHTDLAYW